MPETTFAMTLFDRPPLVLTNTLGGIGKAAVGQDAEVLIVDDGSTFDYGPMLEEFRRLFPLRVVKVDTVADRPGTYHIDGHNNPAYASNKALEHIDSKYLFWWVSDVIGTPFMLEQARKLDLSKVVWMPGVVDLDTQAQFLGPARLAPLGWAMCSTTENFRAVGWDEEYLKGMAFEDNDFTARLALHVGRFVLDRRFCAWHQSHPQKSYSDELVGWKTNREYTVKKWGGVPWYKQEGCPLDIKISNVNHHTVIDVRKQ